MNKKVICDMIEVKGPFTRHEIVQKIINIFISTEYKERGRGTQFRYPVENLSCNAQGSLIETKLFIIRPGGLQKWNFDFKVDVTPEMGLGRGRHKDIASDLGGKKNEDTEKFKQLMQLIDELSSCSETDVDKLLIKYPNLQASFQSGAKLETLLKVLKWMFIMEDIVYWNYDRRLKLHNFLKEI